MKTFFFHIIYRNPEDFNENYLYTTWLDSTELPKVKFINREFIYLNNLFKYYDFSTKIIFFFLFSKKKNI